MDSDFSSGHHCLTFVELEAPVLWLNQPNIHLEFMVELIQLSQEIYFKGKQQVEEYIMKSTLKSKSNTNGLYFCSVRIIPVGLNERQFRCLKFDAFPKTQLLSSNFLGKWKHFGKIKRKID